VTALSATPELREGAIVDAVLGDDEPVEIVLHTDMLGRQTSRTAPSAMSHSDQAV
jgi:hypothetical protein